MIGSQQQLVESLDKLIPLYLRALRTALAEAVGTDRLTMQQLRCLQAIAAPGSEPATTTRLAELMSVSVPTMSSMLDGLSGRALVERQPLVGDRRRVALVITDQGKTLLDHYQEIMDERHRLILSGLTPEERAVVSNAVAVLIGRLETIEASVTPVREPLRSSEPQE